MTEVICKMRCHSKSQKIEGSNVVNVRLGAVFEPDPEKRMSRENAIFGNATPWGECVLGLHNQAAHEFFKEGRSYYITFTEVPAYKE